MNRAPTPDGELEAAKLRALAELAAGAGHEINNPLATILGRAEILLRRIDRLVPTGEAAEARRDLHVIAGQALRIRELIGDLMLFARPPEPKKSPCNLSTASQTAVAASQSIAAERQIQLSLTAPSSVIVSADPTQLAVVLHELLRNALEAVTTGGRIEIAVESLPGGGRISIRDNGPGLSETDREHLFDPFYSGRPAGRGLGFGLSKCWRVVAQHNGTISVTNTDGGGVIATVNWPA